MSKVKNNNQAAQSRILLLTGFYLMLTKLSNSKFMSFPQQKNVYFYNVDIRIPSLSDSSPMSEV